MYDLLNSAYGSSVYVVSNGTVIENNELAKEWKKLRPDVRRCKSSVAGGAEENRETPAVSPPGNCQIPSVDIR